MVKLKGKKLNPYDKNVTVFLKMSFVRAQVIKHYAEQKSITVDEAVESTIDCFLKTDDP